jgi:prepilin-type N-terminal cleavage/methylation domain-containing protein
MNQNKQTSGFTLVELVIAMAFIGILLMAIALTSIQLITLYNKGLTLKQVNAATRVVVQDMQANIANASEIRIFRKADGTGPAANSLRQAMKEDIAVPDPTVVDTHYYINYSGGRLCTGTYSYVWNHSAALRQIEGVGNAGNFNGMVNGSFTPITTNESDTVGKIAEQIGGSIAPGKLQYFDSSGHKIPVKFVKYKDSSRKLCKKSGAAYDPVDEYKLDNYSLGKPEDVFGSGDTNLRPGWFSIISPNQLGAYKASVVGGAGASADLSAISNFYHIRMLLTTGVGDINVAGNGCNTDEAGNSLKIPEYCAMNVIDFVARTNKK